MSTQKTIFQHEINLVHTGLNVLIKIVILVKLPIQDESFPLDSKEYSKTTKKLRNSDINTFSRLLLQIRRKLDASEQYLVENNLDLPIL